MVKTHQPEGVSLDTRDLKAHEDLKVVRGKTQGEPSHVDVEIHACRMMSWRWAAGSNGSP